MKRLKTYKQLNETKRKRPITSITDAIYDGNSREVLRFIEYKNVVLDDYVLRASIVASKYTIFKYLISKYDFSNSILKSLESASERLCSDKTDSGILSTTRFTWLSLLLDKDEINWNDKDSDNKTFIDYLCPEILEKVINKYPEKYDNYLMNKNIDKYKI